MLRVLAIVPIAAVGLTAQTAVSITSCCTTNVVYTFNAGHIPSSNTTSGGSANLQATGASGQDQLFANWWYYRVASDTREFSFNRAATSGLQNPSAPIVVNAKGDTAVIEWVDVDGKGFDARLTTKVYSTSATSGAATQTMEITNRTGAPLTINIFNYADFDVCQSAGTDSAVFAGPPQQLHITDASSCGVTAVHLACNFTNYHTAPFGSTSAQSLMTNTVVDNLSNTGVPFGPADFTNGYQWQDVQIPDGQTATFQVVLAIDHVVPCCDVATVESYCNGKAGTNGIPAWGDTPLFVGGETELTLQNGFAGSAPVVALGVAPGVCVPIPNIGTVAVQPILTTFFLPAFDASGVSTVCLPVPGNPALCGASLVMQAFFADPGAQGGIAHTAGAEFRLGS